MQNKSKRYAQTSLSLRTTSGVRPNVNESKAIMAYFYKGKQEAHADLDPDSGFTHTPTLILTSNLIEVGTRARVVL